ncbi:MAG TPA: winged helix-turn-helix domain-containing protein [Thermoanaerobaculia bacterium]
MRLAFGDSVYDSGTREVTRGNSGLALPPKAFQLLELLIKNRPNAVSKQEIQNQIWPGTFVSDASLANLIAELREALGDDARSPEIIRTVHRFGYAFHADVRAAQARGGAAPRAGIVCRLLWDGCEIQLAPGENLIGREASAAVWIDDALVSRQHARIVLGDEGASLEDLGSKNGTRLAGKRVEGIVPLCDRDQIGIGPATIVFRLYRQTGSTVTDVDGKETQ